MKKRNRKRGREGFTLIEVIASTALLMVTATGFLMMTGANTGLLAKEHRLDQSNYRLSAMAEEGLGEATGAELVVEFSMEGDSGYPDAGAEEIFYQYSVREDEGRDEEFGDCSGPGSSIIVYRHR